MRTATKRDDEDCVAILGEFLHPAGVAELADARDSKSRDLHWSCGFDPHLQHQTATYVCNNLRAYVVLLGHIRPKT